MTQVINPHTNRKVKVGGRTYKQLVKSGLIKKSGSRSKSGSKSRRSASRSRSASKSHSRSRSHSKSVTKRNKRKTSKRLGRSTKRSGKRMSSRRGSSNAGRYPNVAKKDFCGPSGGAAQGTFPVNTPGRARSALARAHFAPNPEGIRKCVARKRSKEGWSGSRSRSGSRSQSKSGSGTNYRRTSKKSNKKSASKKKIPKI